MTTLVPRAPRDSSPPLDRRSAVLESDAELFTKMAGGNLAALGALFDRHHESVLRFLLRATGRGGDADDLLQDTFLSAMRAAKLYDGRTAARPFLIGIAAGLVRHRARGLGRWIRALTAFGDEAPRALSRTPEDDASGAEDLEMVSHAINRLSEEKKLVFLMVAAEGLSGEEVASALGIPVATVWTRLHHARADLRRSLTKQRFK